MSVNWAWAALLTIYHSVFSIAIPVMFVELVFPESAGEKWLGRKGVALALSSLAVVVALGLMEFQRALETHKIYMLATLLSALSLEVLAK